MWLSQVICSMCKTLVAWLSELWKGELEGPGILLRSQCRSRDELLFTVEQTYLLLILVSAWRLVSAIDVKRSGSPGNAIPTKDNLERFDLCLLFYHEYDSATHSIALSKHPFTFTIYDNPQCWTGHIAQKFGRSAKEPMQGPLQVIMHPKAASVIRLGAPGTRLVVQPRLGRTFAGVIGVAK